MFPIWIFLYALIYVAATVAFAKKMMSLTDLRAASVNIHSISPSDDGSIDFNVEDIKLNSAQVKMIESATRYVSLLQTSIISDVTALVIVSIVAYSYTLNDAWPVPYWPLIQVITSINGCVNVLCLYLQYSFANKYYEKYCVIIHRCWRCMLTRKATKSLMKRYQKVIDDNKNSDRELEMSPINVNNE